MSARSSRNLVRTRALLVAAATLGIATAGSLAPTFGQTAPRLSGDYKLIVFKDTGAVGMGAKVRGPADAAHLAGTTHKFKKYVGAEGLRAATPPLGTSCDSEDQAVYVRAYTTNHFAAGAGSPCGGKWGNARVILGKRHHHWKVLIATQDAWDCRLLAHFGVPGRLVKAAPAPVDAAHNCYDYAHHRPGNYHHA